MTTLFLYGTLRHVPLLEIVLGRGAGHISLAPATLPGHGVYAVRGEAFPMILPRPGETAQGVVVQDLSDDDITRLNFYESGFEFGLAEHEVTLPDGARLRPQIYFPAPGLWQPGAPWSLEDWVAEWAAINCHAAREVMAHFGRADPADIARLFPAIQMRAASRAAAEKRPPDPDRDPDRDVAVEEFRYAHLGFFGMAEARLRHRRYDGRMSATLARGGLLTGSAVVVLPYDPVRDSVLLVEQFRAPVHFAGDPAPWMWEPVAGMIDPGETPEQTALREAAEEAHLHLRHLERVGGGYTSSGNSTEYLDLFVGLADLSAPAADGGMAEEGEDIRSRILPLAELLEMIDTARIKDLPLLAIGNWLARHRDRIRRL